MRSLTFTLVLLAGSAQAQEAWFTAGNPPSCDHERAVRRALRVYNEHAETIFKGPKIKSNTPPVEIGTGAPPRSVLYPADLKMTGRYCKMTITLDSGEQEELFYRLLVVEEPKKKPKLEFRHCTKRQDVVRDQCKAISERRG
jgi:hypothetical protein